MTENQRKNQLEAAANGYKLLKFKKNQGYWGRCKLEYITDDDDICIDPFKGMKVKTDGFGKGIVEQVYGDYHIMEVKFESLKHSITCDIFNYVTQHDSSNVQHLFIEI